MPSSLSSSPFVFVLFLFSHTPILPATNKSYRHAATCTNLYGHICRRRGTRTHAQIHMLHAHLIGHVHTHKHSMKVSTAKPILSVFLCALFPTVLVFLTPPVAMCHHPPSQHWSQCYLQTVLRKFQGQKCALGVWTVEQKYEAHAMFEFFIYCCVAQRYITCMVTITTMFLTE